MPVMYRVRQFFRMAGVLPEPADAGLQMQVASYLNPAELALFRRLSPPDQRHALAVATRLLRDGHADRALVQAALLHDVGKGLSRLRLWHRVAVVLASRFAPPLWDWLSRQPSGWRGPFYVARHHARLGADELRSAGSSPEVIWLVQHHDDPGDHQLGQILRAYDSSD